MPAKGNKKKKPAAKTYTSDSLMLRSITGTVLIALGILMLLSILRLLDGAIFDILCEITTGLAGGLGILPGIMMIWAGILCLISTRKKAPWKPFVLSLLICLCIMAAVNLFSQAWDAQNRSTYAFLDYLQVVNQRDALQATPDGFLQILERGYLLCRQTGAAGGAMGLILAWPLWKALGSIGGGIACVLASLGLAFVLMRVDWQKWWANHQARTADKRAVRQQEAAAYQQQQAQQQAALQQQQIYAQQQAAYQPPYYQEPQAIAYDGYYEAPAFYEETIVPQEGEYPAMDWQAASAPVKKKPVKRNAEKASSPKKTPARKAATAQPIMPDPDFEEDIAPWEEEPAKIDPEPMPLTRPQPAKKSSVAPSQPEISAKPRKAQVQPATPMSGEQFDVPKVKLPPRKQNEPKQMEMDLPAPYAYPSLNLLKAPAPQRAENHAEDLLRSQKLEATLESFRIPAKVKHVTHGPAIARYELEIAAGINVSRVANIDKNIAMDLEVKSVRIEAPIPGKSLVGVEVPNQSISAVTLREVLESNEMRRMESPLAVALGKDIAGQPIVCDLERMPHLLIAGATGSGKSVCINAIINSIIYRSTPQQVKMILIDPKMVELQCYNCLPHLLVPVVSDPHKAAGALAWVVAEMMERYQKFKEHSVRNITGYNASLFDGEESMARIVVIIDELADLMMTCKKDVEEYICRLAQLARAAGIHLVVATQRPSVDVITGLIKANIPSRIAFTVSSSIDSRTILDRVGAEKLLGRGDMLYLPNGELTPFRVQGCFLSDDEVNRVTDFVKRTSVVEFDPDVLEKLEESAPVVGNAPDDAEPVDVGDGEDPLLAQAIELAVQDGQTSISMLQRRLRIGHSRAGRIVDEMSRRGILSQADGSKPRQVLITREEYEEMCRVSEE